MIIATVDDMDIGSRDRVRYVPTYFPNTPIASEAQRVVVGPGQEVPGMVVTLARAATANVRGVIRSSGEASLGPLTMITAREVGGPGADGHMAMGVAASDGAFSIAGLLPGTYMLETRSMTGTEVASKEVVVDGSDVTGVSLVLSEGTNAHGRIVLDAGTPPQGLRPSQVFIVVNPLDRRSQAMDMRTGPPIARTTGASTCAGSGAAASFAPRH